MADIQEETEILGMGNDLSLDERLLVFTRIPIFIMSLTSFISRDLSGITSCHVCPTEKRLDPTQLSNRAYEMINHR